MTRGYNSRLEFLCRWKGEEKRREGEEVNFVSSVVRDSCHLLVLPSQPLPPPTEGIMDTERYRPREHVLFFLNITCLMCTFLGQNSFSFLDFCLTFIGSDIKLLLFLQMFSCCLTLQSSHLSTTISRGNCIKFTLVF